jgi:hypothetical protein
LGDILPTTERELPVILVSRLRDPAERHAGDADESE